MNIIDKWILDPITRTIKGMTRGGQASGAIGAQYPANLTVTGTNWTTAVAKGVAYHDGEVWRLKFGITGAVSVAVNDLTLTIAGITFSSDAASEQLISAGQLDTVGSSKYTAYSVAQQNASTIRAAYAATVTNFVFAGDVRLKSKPTWVP